LCVQVRRTQDPEYWKEYRLDETDTEAVRDLIVEAARPLPLEELARAVVFRRVHGEREKLRRLMEQGRFYRPADSYELGEELIFAAFDLATGVVTGKRDAFWPGHSPFKVIAVELGGETREFASEYVEEHPLNQASHGPDGAEEGLAPEDVYLANRVAAESAVAAALAERSTEFRAWDGLWLALESMPEVHVGYLNLAEAVIEVAWEEGRAGSGQQSALSTSTIIEQIELKGSSQEAAVFALELALSSDERFVDVGSDGEPSWLLRRLIPPQVLEVPERLQYEPIPFSMEAIPTEALELVWSFPDEHSVVGRDARAAEAAVSRAEIALPYPHRRAGTLPLAGPVAAVLPRRSDGVSVVTLVDETNDERMTAWVAHSGGYIYGLADWYERHDVPCGGFLSLERTKRPGLLKIEYRGKRRTQREYVRVAVATDSELTFEMRRQPMSVEFDETGIMLDDSEAASDRLWRQTRSARTPLADILRQVFAQLAKLSPQGTVHLNTLCSAINVLRRCPPEPILAELSLDWRYVGVGNGYYALDERALSQER